MYVKNIKDISANINILSNTLSYILKKGTILKNSDKCLHVCRKEKVNHLNDLSIKKNTKILNLF